MRVRKIWNLAGVFALAAFLAAGSAGAALERSAQLVAPKDAPQRPRTIAPYPGVHDLPSPRSTPTMSDAEKLRLEKELNEARRKQRTLEDPTVKQRGAAATAKSTAAKEKAQSDAKKKPSAPNPQ